MAIINMFPTSQGPEVVLSTCVLRETDRLKA